MPPLLLALLLACGPAPVRLLETTGSPTPDVVDIENETNVVLTDIEFLGDGDTLASGNFEVGPRVHLRLQRPDGTTDLYVAADDQDWSFTQDELQPVVRIAE